MQHPIFRILLLAFFLIQSALPAQNRRICLLDLTARNAESTDGNLYSAEHLLQLSGIPFQTTDTVNKALSCNFILCSSNIETTTFTQPERDSLRAFVNRGGILFVTQLKDSSLFDLFGISDYTYSTQHYNYRWNYSSSDSRFRWIDDPLEKEIKLADSSYAVTLNSRDYRLSGAHALATFENDSVALCEYDYGSGHTYLLGLNWKDLFLRNQVMASYNASRSYSNGFEPGSDVFPFFLRAAYYSLFPHAVWKHTSGRNSKASLIITHDVDATTSIRDQMRSFASYEHSNHIQATYFITTHYMHDSIAKDFWNGYTDNIREVMDYGHEIGSHSVSHVPDFDIESLVPEGSCGNTASTYQPFYNGSFSSNVTVCGETEVSKQLLSTEIGATIRSYRAGYLAYNNKLLNSLETNGYSFNSTHSANDVLSEFPFKGHLDLSMSGSRSSILEIPNTISDVFKSDPISELNFMQKELIWEDVLRKNAANHAPTVLLIHPNRTYKLMAEQQLIRSLPQGVRILPLEQYGDYWLSRESMDFDQEMVNDSELVITVHNSALTLNKELSLVVHKGTELSSVRVEDESHLPLPLLQAPWENGDLILYSESFTNDYTSFYFEPGIVGEGFSNYPNPFVQQTTFELEVMFPCHVVLRILDATGRLVDEPVDEELEVGQYHFLYDQPGLAPGLYFYEYEFNGIRPKLGKMLITK